MCDDALGFHPTKELNSANADVAESPLQPRSLAALRDETLNGCEGD